MKLKDRMLRAGPIWKRIVKRSDSFFRMTIIAGATAGDHAVTDIKATDKLVAVLALDAQDTTPARSDITSEFTITKDGTINNTGGTDTSASTYHLIVAWEAYDER